MLICGVALCFSMSAYGQAVTIDLQNVTVKKAITELKEKTGYSVVFSTEDLDTRKVVSVKATDLREAVGQIIAGQNVTFEVQGNRIIIHRDASQDANGRQQGTVKGVVRGNDSEPIIGATVIVKGTTIGTLTDADGRFELNASPDATLVISYLGYRQAEASARKGDLKVTLDEDTELLDDVVVVGYGSVKKSNLTGAVASVKMDKVEKVATTDVSNLLMGRVAGLDISQTSASPDGSYSMVIRGQASTGAGNTPLYVIDGFPGGDISTVNPSDIESVEVLKDASSTSIYGARAANGVILVTTKKGKEGKAVVNLKLSGSLQAIENPYDIVDAREYMQLANSYYYEKWLYSNGIAPYGTTDPSTVTSTPTYPFTDADIAGAVNIDYWDLMTRTGVINEENLSISGGSEKVHYLLSMGHYNQKGVIENSGKQKFMARFNMDYSFNKYITTGVTASGTRSLFDLLQESSSGDNLSIINSIIMFPNYLQPYTADGGYALNPNHGGNNPLSLNEVTNRRKNTSLLISNYWNFQITPDLLARVSWGWNYGETRRDEYYPKSTYTGMQSNSSATISQTTRNDYLLDATLTYSKTLADIHAIKVMDFTDAVLAKYPQIDPRRLCETGGSYGGFMTNWIIGHTGRFCCAAAQRSIANWLGFYGMSDIGFYFAADQTAGDIYDSPEKLWAQSPLKYAANVTTPTLFIHSDEDYRCPMAEGLQMYASLVDRGVEARLCLFHGETHELSRSGKPKHRQRRLKEITDWFEGHAK